MWERSHNSRVSFEHSQTCLRLFVGLNLNRTKEKQDMSAVPENQLNLNGKCEVHCLSTKAERGVPNVGFYFEREACNLCIFVCVLTV